MTKLLDVRFIIFDLCEGEEKKNTFIKKRDAKILLRFNLAINLICAIFLSSGNMPQCKVLRDKTRHILCDLLDKHFDKAIRFWETAKLPLPKVNINTYLLL